MSIFENLFGNIFPKKEDDRYRIKKLNRTKCKKCDKGTMYFSGNVRWSGGMPDGRDLIEQFYKCDHCGHTVSNQFD